MSRDPAYLEDILHAARLVRVGTEGISREAFTQDWMRLSAVAYQIEIIGEATKRLSDDLKKLHPEIPWRKMAGMQDVLIHAYDELDVGELWNTAHDDIPKLIAMIEPLVPPEEEAQSKDE